MLKDSFLLEIAVQLWGTDSAAARGR